MAIKARAAKAGDRANKKLSQSSQLFGEIANVTSRAAGRAPTFAAAVAVVLIWAVTGPLFGFSDTWQLVINTGTTIVTFLMVFLIQNTQNRDSRALHLKLDELILSIHGARNKLIDLENCSDEELDRVQREFEVLKSQLPRQHRRAGAPADPAAR